MIEPRMSLESSIRDVVGTATRAGDVDSDRAANSVVADLIEHLGQPAVAARSIDSASAAVGAELLNMDSAGRVDHVSVRAEDHNIVRNRPAGPISLSVGDAPCACEFPEAAILELLFAASTQKNHQKNQSKFPHIDQGIRTGLGRLLSRCS